MTKTTSSPSVSPLAIIAGIGAGIVGAVLYWLLVKHVGLQQSVPMLAVGALVGLAVRLTSQTGDAAAGWVAALITIVFATLGFIWADSAIWTPFDLQLTIQRLLSILGILVLAISAYIAFALAKRG